MSRSARTLLAALVTVLIVVAGGTPAAEALNGHPYAVLMPSNGSAPNLPAATPHLIRLPDTSTTKSRSVDSTYDVRCDLRVVTQAAHAVETTVGTVTYQRERSLDRPTEAQGASTTPVARGVATEAVEHGPFYRLESTTQTPEVARLQEVNGELWGATPRGGMQPTVQAYNGPLPPGKRGVEFMTTVKPGDVGLGGPGHIARWYQGSPGVENISDEMVKISCRVVVNTQC